MSYYHYLLVHGCNNVIIDQLTKQISKVDICTLYTIVEDLGHSVFLDRAIIQLSTLGGSLAQRSHPLFRSSRGQRKAESSKFLLPETELAITFKGKNAQKISNLTWKHNNFVHNISSEIYEAAGQYSWLRCGKRWRIVCCPLTSLHLLDILRAA